MNKYEKMWEHMKNALWKCYWRAFFMCSHIMNRVEMEINTREEAKADSGRE